MGGEALSRALETSVTGKGNEGLEMEQVKPQEQARLRTGSDTGRGDWSDQSQEGDEAKMLFSIQLRVNEDVRARKCGHNHIEFLEMNLTMYVSMYVCICV